MISKILCLSVMSIMLFAGYSDNINKSHILKDSVTGLEWQNEPYTQDEKKARYENTNIGKVGNREYAKKYCNNLVLDGYDDWRLPNIYELVSLIDNTKSKDPFVIDGFENFDSDFFYWSSTSAEGTDVTWDVDFYFGIYSWEARSIKNFIRCVRAKELNFENLITLKNSGKLKISQENISNISAEIKPKKELKTPVVVRDSVTGLDWQDDSDVINFTEDWHGANKYCENLTLGGYKDWRLPNIYELATLIDNTKTKAPFMIDGFSNVDSIFSWSSNPFAMKKEGWAWGVEYLNGSITWHNTDDKNDYSRDSYTRCVRNKELSFKDFIALKNKGSLKINEINMSHINRVVEEENKKASK